MNYFPVKIYLKTIIRFGCSIDRIIYWSVINVLVRCHLLVFIHRVLFYVRNGTDRSVMINRHKKQAQPNH